jgi:hypothetical protein
MSEELESIISERVYEIRAVNPDITKEDLKELIYDEVLDTVDDTVTDIWKHEEDKELQYI